MSGDRLAMNSKSPFTLQAMVPSIKSIINEIEAAGYRLYEPGKH